VDLLNNIAETTESTMADVENADMVEVDKNDKQAGAELCQAQVQMRLAMLEATI
jgi:hypothetical protein